MGKEVVLVLPRTRRIAALTIAVAVPAVAASLLLTGSAQANGTNARANTLRLVPHNVQASGQHAPYYRPGSQVRATTAPARTSPVSTPTSTHIAPTTTTVTTAPTTAPSTTVPTRTTTTATTTAPRTTTAPPTSTAPAGIVDEPAYATAVLNLLNSERASHGLPALVSNSKLVCSAYHHNLSMAAANTMSHQLPGEPDVGGRESACGYTWSRWAENIGWSTDLSVNGATGLETAMYNEVPPNDGHRLNILSPNLTQIGVSVIIDNAHHKVWLTEDFGTP